MIRHSTLLLTLASGMFSVSAANASPPDGKLWNGTWHLNAKASKWGAAGKEMSETRIYDFSGGKLSLKSSGKNGKGKDMSLAYSAGCDGKTVPMTGSPNADSVSLTCVSGREIRATSSLKGKTTVKSVATISADGKQLTLKRTYVGMKGAPTEVLVFTR
ncbi:hypothetical protein [Sphingomonas limnosediminicola]|uniref:hypothetical protein n=1 Tax=Sphingomonas limnosediminicola TaxID=940133 RepID=UPI0031DF1525